MHGYVWLCRVMYPYVGLCMAMYGYGGYVGWCSGIDGFLITLISGSLQKGSEPFLYLTLCSRRS